MCKICKAHTRVSITYAIVTMDSKIRISNLKDQLYSQLVKFIKQTIEVIKKDLNIFMVLVLRSKQINKCKLRF